MAQDLSATFRSVLDRLHELAVSDPVLRTRLRELAGAVLALTEEPPPAAPAAPEPAAPPAPEPAEPTGPFAVAAAPADLLPPAAPAPEALAAAEPSPPQVGDADLPVIEERCRLKAEAARWAAERQRRLRDGADYLADIVPQDQALIARAKGLPDCYLWMWQRDAADLYLYEDLAGCFDAAAAAVGLLRAVIAQPVAEDDFEQALELAAEAQSALRVAVAMLGRYTDGDQLKIFIWLREAAAERHFLIRRYMRRDDPADPANWAGLQERLRQFGERLRRGRDRDRRRRHLVNQVRYHLKRIRTDPGADHDYDWRKIVEVVDTVVAEGLPPSNVELRELLLPILDDLPDLGDWPKHFALVLREIDRYLASRPAAPAGGDDEPPPTEDVRRAAELLRGRVLVLIGGEPRPGAEAALTTALGLKELIWVGGREHQTYTAFEPYVARDDVAAVVLAIRWSSHSFGEVREFCDRYGKPLVRLPAGYNPNLVAYHIMNQIGERLAARRAAAG